MSSWDDYIEKQLIASKCVQKGVIAGHDGHVWAYSEGFKPSVTELSTLMSGFDNNDILTGGGVHLAGQRYFYLSGDANVVRGKFGKVGIHCRKTKQAVVIGLYEEPIQPQQAAQVVEKLGDYLEQCGY